MESVSQSITGTGVVYFPPTHHLLHLALAMILSVLLSRTLTQQCVTARLISPGGTVRMRVRIRCCLCWCAAFSLLSIYSHLGVSWSLDPQSGRQICVLLSCALKHDDVLHPFISHLHLELTSDVEIIAL